MLKDRQTITQPLIGLVACFVAAFALLAYPLYVIRPFRYQGPRELVAALFILRFRLVVELLLAAAAIGLAIVIWRSSRGVMPRITAVLCATLVAGCGLLARVNVYERMFTPVSVIAFSPASHAKFDPDEQVIAVKIGSAARAYPIRSISYHHIVNDMLGGIPIVATY